MRTSRDQRRDQHARFEALRREGFLLHEESRQARREAREAIAHAHDVLRKTEDAKRRRRQQRP